MTSQLVLKWARQSPETPILLTDDFTRLTLDTIALCSMGVRLNLFYRDSVHPFVESVAAVLDGSQTRSRRPNFWNALPTKTNRKYWQDIKSLRGFCHEIVMERRKCPGENNDLLDSMINGRDKLTGKAMENETVINNLITVLIAGEEYCI